jgi:multidrug resistance efflux pump
MPDDVAENLVRTVSELREQSNALAAKSQQESEMRAQFQADIERYRELHTIHSQ